MATARLTLGSVLGTVTTAAETLTGALGTVSNSVGMLNAYVEKAADEQRKRHLVDAKTFDVELAQEKSAELTRSAIEVDKFRGLSARHAELFDESYSMFMDMLAPKKVDSPLSSFKIAAE